MAESCDTEIFRKAIVRNYVAIKKYLQPDPIIDCETGFELLTVADRKNIKGKDQTDKNEAILRKVISKGAKGYTDFKEFLKKTWQTELLELIVCAENGQDTKEIESRLKKTAVLCPEYIKHRGVRSDVEPSNGTAAGLIGGKGDAIIKQKEFRARTDSSGYLSIPGHIHGASRLDLKGIQQRVEGQEDKIPAVKSGTQKLRLKSSTGKKSKSAVKVTHLKTGAKQKSKSKSAKTKTIKVHADYTSRRGKLGKYVRRSDDDEWESDDLSEVEKRNKLKLGSKHTTKTRLKARNKPKRRMKRTGTRKIDVPDLLEMLYLVYNELVSLCIDIASVYATTTPYNAKDPILLCLTTKNCDHIPPKFKGFSTIQKPFYPKLTESESYINETYRYDAKSCKEIDETIAFHAESLMMKHKNLEAIKMGLVRSSKNNVIQEPGIVLVCRYKSYIPIDEYYFPSKLQHPSSKTFYHTDVKEGYFRLSSSLTRRPCEYNEELAMGCSIGPENDGISASLGPFVNIKETNELCFLTVRHLFQPLDEPDEGLSGINVVQPAISDHSWKNDKQQNDRRCGTVKVAELSNNIDAALVEIYPSRAPSRGYFVGIKPGDLDDTGFAASCLPSYDDGCVRDARQFLGQDYAHDRVIKFGKQTGLTKGAIQTRNMAVRLRDEMGHIQCGSRMQSRLMIQQLQIDSFARKIFFEKGDSGSAVFSVDKTNKLFCIGMAIGVMSDKTCIVTPIQNILERLGQKLRQTLELKAFPSEKMEF